MGGFVPTKSTATTCAASSSSRSVVATRPWEDSITGDNLNGLPAALLTAGVSSIVASLWELSDDAAATSFPRLYSELARDVSRLEAFRQAQLAVRKAFPQPRDWAAFCYIGSWSDPDPAVLAGESAYIKLEH